MTIVRNSNNVPCFEVPSKLGSPTLFAVNEAEVSALETVFNSPMPNKGRIAGRFTVNLDKRGKVYCLRISAGTEVLRFYGDRAQVQAKCQEILAELRPAKPDSDIQRTADGNYLRVGTLYFPVAFLPDLEKAVRNILPGERLQVFPPWPYLNFFGEEGALRISLEGGWTTAWGVKPASVREEAIRWVEQMKEAAAGEPYIQTRSLGSLIEELKTGGLKSTQRIEIADEILRRFG